MNYSQEEKDFNIKIINDNAQEICEKFIVKLEEKSRELFCEIMESLGCTLFCETVYDELMVMVANALLKYEDSKKDINRSIMH